MLRPALFLLIAALTTVMTVTPHSAARADDPLIFISNFAPAPEGAIQAATFDLQTGTLKLGVRTTGAENPFFLALSKDRKFLYSIYAKNFGGQEPEQVAAYSLTGRTGELKLLNRVSSKGTASCYLETDATGKTVMVANYSTGNLAAYPVKTDGSLGEAATFIQHAGSSVNPKRQKGPYAHCIVVSPDNRFAFAADLGLDQIRGYQLDPTQAKLTPNVQPFARTPPGSGPRHLTFHPNGKHLYAINELGNTVTMYNYVAESGLLLEQQTISTVPEGFDGESYTADVKLTPDGKFLYGTNRGHDSIACYKVAADGRLSLIKIEPSRGKGPQNLAILPGGGWLLCANMPGNNVAIFQINPQTGELKPHGDTVPQTGPSCLMVVDK